MRAFLLGVVAVLLAEPAWALSLRLNVRTQDGSTGSVVFSVDSFSIGVESCAAYPTPLCLPEEVYLRLSFGTPDVHVDLGPLLRFSATTRRAEAFYADRIGVSPGASVSVAFDGDRFFDPYDPPYLYAHEFQFRVPTFDRLDEPNLLAAVRAGLVGSTVRLTHPAGPWVDVHRLTVESTEWIPLPEPERAACLGIGFAGLAGLAARKRGLPVAIGEARDAPVMLGPGR